MDIDKVPQNKENLHNGNYKTVVYAVDKNGDYIAAKTSGWEPEDIAHEHAWGVIDKRIQDTKELVIQNELSPIAYFMEKNLMTPKRLAAAVGFKIRKVKKHITPKGFSKMTNEYLEKYASIFEVEVNDIINFS